MKKNKLIKIVASISGMGAIGTGTIMSISSCSHLPEHKAYDYNYTADNIGSHSFDAMQFPTTNYTTAPYANNITDELMLDNVGSKITSSPATIADAILIRWVDSMNMSEIPTTKSNWSSISNWIKSNLPSLVIQFSYSWSDGWLTSCKIHLYVNIDGKNNMDMTALLTSPARCLQVKNDNGNVFMEIGSNDGDCWAETINGVTNYVNSLRVRLENVHTWANCTFPSVA